jgi:hypothetical protein
MKRSGGYGKRTEFKIPLQRLEKLAALVEMMDLWSSKKPVETARERNAVSRYQK